MPLPPSRELDWGSVRRHCSRVRRARLLAILLLLGPWLLVIGFQAWEWPGLVAGTAAMALYALKSWGAADGEAMRDCARLATTHRWGAFRTGEVVRKSWSRLLGHPFLWVRVPSPDRRKRIVRCFCTPAQWKRVVPGGQVAFLEWQGHVHQHCSFGACLPAVAPPVDAGSTDEARAEDALRFRLGACLARMQARLDSSTHAGCALLVVLTGAAVMASFLATDLAASDAECFVGAVVITCLVGCPALFLLRAWLRRRMLAREVLAGGLQFDPQDLPAARRMLSEYPDPCDACTLALTYLDRQAQLACATGPPGPQGADEPGTAATGS